MQCPHQGAKNSTKTLVFPLTTLSKSLSFRLTTSAARAARREIATMATLKIGDHILIQISYLTQISTSNVIYGVRLMRNISAISLDEFNGRMPAAARRRAAHRTDVLCSNRGLRCSGPFISCRFLSFIVTTQTSSERHKNTRHKQLKMYSSSI